MKKIFLLAILCTLVACDSKQPNLELIQDMMDQGSIKAQDYNPKAADGLAMRVPPAGTVPMDQETYLIPNTADGLVEAGRKMKNPYSNLSSKDAAEQKEVLARGKEKFDIYCAVCHGSQGRGDGTVANKMNRIPPTLLSDKIRNYQDGSIFHIVTHGFGMMGSYAGQVGKFEDRWAIVTWVRQLQKMNK